MNGNLSLFHASLLTPSFDAFISPTRTPPYELPSSYVQRLRDLKAREAKIVRREAELTAAEASVRRRAQALILGQGEGHLRSKISPVVGGVPVATVSPSSSPCSVADTIHRTPRRLRSSSSSGSPGLSVVEGFPIEEGIKVVGVGEPRRMEHETRRVSTGQIMDAKQRSQGKEFQGVGRREGELGGGDVAAGVGFVSDRVDAESSACR